MLTPDTLSRVCMVDSACSVWKLRALSWDQDKESAAEQSVSRESAAAIVPPSKQHQREGPNPAWATTCISEHIATEQKKYWNVWRCDWKKERGATFPKKHTILHCHLLWIDNVLTSSTRLFRRRISLHTMVIRYFYHIIPNQEVSGAYQFIIPQLFWRGEDFSSLSQFRHL